MFLFYNFQSHESQTNAQRMIEDGNISRPNCTVDRPRDSGDASTRMTRSAALKKSTKPKCHVDDGELNRANEVDNTDDSTTNRNPSASRQVSGEGTAPRGAGLQKAVNNLTVQTKQKNHKKKKPWKHTKTYSEAVVKSIEKLPDVNRARY